jgi:hypothetical protein
VREVREVVSKVIQKQGRARSGRTRKEREKIGRSESGKGDTGGHRKARDTGARCKAVKLAKARLLVQQQSDGMEDTVEWSIAVECILHHFSVCRVYF